MQKAMIAVMAAVLSASPLVASDNTDVMATVNKLVEDLNKGDKQSVLAACTGEISLIDEFPPYEWHGAGTFSQWFEDYDAWSKKNGITDGVSSIGNPVHMDVTDDRAYVVVPAGFTYKRNGKSVKETGPWAITLKKTEAGWRITGSAWAEDAASSAQAPVSSPAEAVRQADRSWSEAFASKDVERVLAFYDENGAFLGTTPPTEGIEPLRKLWTRFFTMPGYKLTWKTERVEVSARGDLAYSSGPWEEAVIRNGQSQTNTGTYLAVWKRQRDGSWKVLADKP